MHKPLLIALILTLLTAFAADWLAPEPYRLRFHFSPKAHWINDPNGMVYYKGTYHLFYQYHPASSVWGPMHWGHTTSKDMVHWQEQAVALYPDSLGYIFSGSAVVDAANTSGFGKNGQVPLVAIFTHHNPKLEKSQPTQTQYQSLAYSLDNGKTWTKYARNPVLKNPGITDFRDPKVRWYAATKKWVMTLATKDHVTFYSSPNLKNWTKESEFGRNAGEHGGVWECPDLFPLRHNGKDVWVLIVSVNPGGPNKGSAAQYFLGDFDGKTFRPNSTQTKWMDYGTDNYAGVTFANTGNRVTLIGWMNNWQYARDVPTEGWRGATTVPRDLGLKDVNGALYLTSTPAKELAELDGKPITLTNLNVKGTDELTARTGGDYESFKLTLSAPATADFAVVLANERGNELLIGYDKAANSYYVDRTKSGKTGFEKDFGKRITAPRLSTDGKLTLTLLIDTASAELFADDGLSVLTAIFFPARPMSKLAIRSVSGITFSNVTLTPLSAAIQ